MKFYSQEIKLRNVLKYPPFCDIIKLEVSDLSEAKAKYSINFIYQKLIKNANNQMSIYAPMPCPISKIKNRYRYRIIIKCILGNSIINQISYAINTTNVSNNTRISVDINPNNMN